MICAHVFSGLHDFLVNFAQPVECLHFLELAYQVGDHPARYLVRQHAGVDDGEFLAGQQVFVFGRDLFEVFAAESLSEPPRAATMGSIAGIEERSA